MQIDLLLKELEIIQFKITEYDKLSFKIKGWSITLWTGIILWGIYALLPGILISIIQGIALSIFWFLDTLFKIYQRYHVVRLEWIQDFVNQKNNFADSGLSDEIKKGRISNLLFFDVNSRMGSQYDNVFKDLLKRKTNILRCLFVRNIFPIYIGLILVGIYIGIYLENYNSIVLISYGIIATTSFMILLFAFLAIHKYIIIPSDKKPYELPKKEDLVDP